ncbi:MAG: hypothetical protein AB2L17_00660 [Lentimicrobium sp.]|jgi:hypothetical protein
MSAGITSIQFSYLYRDAGNYKLFGKVVFRNPENLSLEEIRGKIRTQLIDGEFFDAAKWGLPLLQFEDYLPEVDHSWYEFEDVELTSIENSDNRTIAEFIKEIQVISENIH